MRAFDTVLRMVPKVAVPSVLAGFPKAGWFHRLKNSASKRKFTRSRKEVILEIRASHRLDPGPRSVSRPSVP